jgi:hypothetical protein
MVFFHLENVIVRRCRSEYLQEDHQYDILHNTKGRGGLVFGFVDKIPLGHQQAFEVVYSGQLEIS